jgi:hypothetical protein
MHAGYYGHDYAAASLRSILSILQTSKHWNEIACFHNLPEIKSEAQLKKERAKEEKEKEKQQQILSQYAVRWNIHTKKIPATHKKALEKYIDDTEDSSVAVMDEEDRIQLIQQMGTLRKLRAARGKAVINEPGQKVIDTILKGPPFKIEKIEESALPYWLQAVAWFEGIMPGLPSRHDISTELQRRRHRSRLLRSAGPDFQGRKNELKTLQEWYASPESGAMIISGIGGIGKSGLISKFALALPEGTMLFWLDFDRADLAPDKAMSVLRVLSDQLSFQANDYTAATPASQEWELAAEELGVQLQKHIDIEKPALLVLDGFEVAQHSKRYNQIEPLFKALLQKTNALKIIISGRATVDKLKFDDRQLQYLSLTGLEENAAKQWLQKHGINSPGIISKTYKISRGIPLSLKLAVRHIDDGGKISELPNDLPQILVDGFLYQRICDRTVNPRLRNIVKDILILRIISPGIIEKILFDNIPAKMNARQVFEGILREMSLVPEVEFVSDNAEPESSVTMVNIRPEVRSAALKLLERENEKRVRTIDERAIKFYKKKRKPQDAEKIELIYHYLRTGKIKNAEKLWQQDYSNSLDVNAEDIPEKYADARKWLQDKTGHAPLEMNIDDWETDAYNRIKALRIRGHLDAIPGVLGERKERSTGSRLLIYDAWILWQNHRDVKQALRLLDPANHYTKNITPVVYYERQVVAARIAYQSGDNEHADHILDTLLKESNKWSKVFRMSVSLASLASRIMFAASLQLKKEIELYEILSKKERGVTDLTYFLHGMISYADLIIPQLRESKTFLQFQQNPFIIPGNPVSKTNSKKQLESMRFFPGNKLRELSEMLGTDRYDHQQADKEIRVVMRKFLTRIPEGRQFALSVDISSLAWLRWHLALTGFWFDDFVKAVESEKKAMIARAFSATPAFASFRGAPMKLTRKTRLKITLSSIDRLVDYVIHQFNRNFASTPIHVTQDAKKLALRYLKLIKDFRMPVYFTDWLKKSSMFRTTDELPIQDMFAIDDVAVRTILFLILMPNPIEVAGNEVLGLPYIFTNEDYLSQKRFS